MLHKTKLAIAHLAVKAEWRALLRRTVACYSSIVPALQKMIGQMFMVGVKATELTPEERLIFNEAAVGGFILFKHNVIDPEQIVALCRSLWDLEAEHPPFIAIDEEGGRVHRLPAPFTRFPAAARVGQLNDPDLAYRLGKATAEELTLVGINLDFAPVLDVNSNPQNPIIGDRSFAADPTKVIKLSEKWTQGLRDGGIIPCGKHFPGHGHTDKDSHLDLPVVDRSLDELKATEFPPFIHACRNGIEALMTAHVLYRALDPKLPATLSRAIVTGLLRQQFGYGGVVFSDDLEMKAISDNYGCPHLFPPRDAGERGGGLEEAVLLAIGAGIDVLLYGHELDKAMDALEFLCARAEREPALRSQVENSYERIAQLKRRCVKFFTGVAENELAARLVLLDHQRIVDEIHGSL
ncbi:MAG TPA: beta-N-acetylhexosaminidase [Candidatus Binatia bacterium]